MKYKVGDEIRIVKKRTAKMNPDGKMDCWLGKVMTIDGFCFVGNYCYMKEDGGKWHWYDEMIAGKVEEKHSSDYYLFKYLSAKLSEKEAELTAQLSEIKKIQKEIKEVLDNES